MVDGLPKLVVQRVLQMQPVFILQHHSRPVAYSNAKKKQKKTKKPKIKNEICLIIEGVCRCGQCLFFDINLDP